MLYQLSYFRFLFLLHLTFTASFRMPGTISPGLPRQWAATASPGGKRRGLTAPLTRLVFPFAPQVPLQKFVVMKTYELCSFVCISPTVPCKQVCRTKRKRKRSLTAPTVFIKRTFLWAKMDSNHRRRTSADLQSAPFGHSGIRPESQQFKITANPQSRAFRIAKIGNGFEFANFFGL